MKTGLTTFLLTTFSLVSYGQQPLGKKCMIQAAHAQGVEPCKLDVVQARRNRSIRAFSFAYF
jgi:hypothetical protein